MLIGVELPLKKKPGPPKVPKEAFYPFGVILELLGWRYLLISLTKKKIIISKKK